MLNMELMKRYDHLLGLPVCFILGLYQKVINLFVHQTRVAPPDPAVIFVSKFFGLGSIILIAPMLKKIKEQYKNSRLVFLTFSENSELLNLIGICDEIITIRKSTLLFFLTDTLKAMLKINKLKADIAIDFEFFSKYTSLFSFFSRADFRIGFYWPAFWRTSLYTHLIHLNQRKHILDAHRMIATALNLKDYKYKPLKIDIERQLQSKVKSILCEYIPNNSKTLIGVNVNSSDLAFCRRWPKEYFVKLIGELVLNHNCHVILTGSNSEAAYTSECFNMLPEEVKNNSTNMAGKWCLTEFLALLNHFKVFVTNDSGPAHLASTQDVLTVSIWGPGSPSYYGVDSDFHRQIYLDYLCSPCIYIYKTTPGYFCDENIDCLTNLKPEMVLPDIIDLLERPG